MPEKNNTKGTPIMKTIPFYLILSLLLPLSAWAVEDTNDTLAADSSEVGGTLLFATILEAKGKSVARYLHGGTQFKPYIDELQTPSGKNILRDAPEDHLHHHGLMYAIKVDGQNFWEENDPHAGRQVTVRIQHSGNFLESEIDWNTSESKTLLKETRKISVNRTNDVTLLDWQSTLKTANDAELDGGHYHGLGMRFVHEMDKDGRFFNDTNKHDGEIVRGDERLTRCRWMAYTTKLAGQPVTVAVFDHPSNPVPMTVFTMGDASDAFVYLSATMNLHRESINLKAGEEFAVRYQVAVWDGEQSHETIDRVCKVWEHAMR